MSALSHFLKLLGLVAVTIVVGFVVLGLLLKWIAVLTEDSPPLGCIGIPGALFVFASSVAIAILAST